MIAAQLTPPAKGFDTISQITAAKAKVFAADGFAFRIGYVARSLHAPQKSQAGSAAPYKIKREPGFSQIYHLSRECVRWSLDAGLAVGAVQSYYDGELGYSHGRRLGTIAAANLLGIGIEQPIHLAYDLEHSKAPADDLLEDMDGWADGVKGESPFRPWLYNGYRHLTPGQLYSLRGYDCYWRAGMVGLPDVYRRGYAMVQHPQESICGVTVDVNDLTGDRLGGSPYFLVA